MKHQAGLQKELSAPRTVLSPFCWTPISWAQVEWGHHQNEGHTSGIYNRNYRILTTHDSTYDSKMLDKYLTKQHHKVCLYCINFYFFWEHCCSIIQYSVNDCTYKYTMLYIRSSQWIHLITETLSPFTNISLFLYILPLTHPHNPVPETTIHSLYLWLFKEILHISDQFSSVARAYWTLCDPMDWMQHVRLPCP